MYIFIREYLCVFMFIHMCACAYVCLHVYVCFVYVNLSMHVYIWCAYLCGTRVCTCVRLCVYDYIYVHVHVFCVSIYDCPFCFGVNVTQVS